MIIQFLLQKGIKTKLDRAYLSSDIHQGHSCKLKTLTCDTLKKKKKDQENVSAQMTYLLWKKRLNCDYQVPTSHMKRRHI